jgi:leucyl-tRNA synthetase
MSKSKGNVVNPETVSEKYGIDTARYFLLSLAEPDKPRDWSEKGILGSLRFVNKIFETFKNIEIGKTSDKIEILLNKTIEGITQDIESFRYRMATIKLKELFEEISNEKEISKESLEKSLKLLSPICPHIAEELYERINCKGLISNSSWPSVDKTKINAKEKTIDLNKKVIENAKEILEKTGNKKKIFIYVMPFEVNQISLEKIKTEFKGKEVKIFTVNDKEKYDPENKAKKAKPQMPSIYVE